MFTFATHAHTRETNIAPLYCRTKNRFLPVKYYFAKMAVMSRLVSKINSFTFEITLGVIQTFILNN